VPVEGSFRIVVENASLFFDRKLSAKNSLKRLFIAGEKSVSTIQPFYALKNLSFSVRDGEVMGVIGNNGAGKSTLLRMVAGIYSPNEGRISLRGESSLLALGTGFQPDLSGLDNIKINATLLGMSLKELESKIQPIVEFAELEDFIDLPLKNYSSGMRSRLGFSIAIHINRDILLVDETLSVGDAKFRTKSKRRIRELIKEDRTVLLVSHSMTQIKQLCHRVIWLENGQLVEIGKAKEVVDRYLESTKS
jgi:ABC-2 type transport system ATP-binding protein